MKRIRELSRAGQEATAYHEAGHAVVKWILGLPIDDVSIVRDEESHGHTTGQPAVSDLQLDSDNSDEARIRAEKDAMDSLAGMIAQRRFRPRSCRNYHASRDWKCAEDLLSGFVQSDRELNALLKLLEIRNQDLFDLHWKLVEKVAAALIEHKQLSKVQFETLMQE